MIPVMQNQFGDKGNCFSACLASLFELSINDVPNFYDVSNDPVEWWCAVRDWLKIRGFGIMSIHLHNPEILKDFEGYFIVCGESSRGLQHATIYKNGEMYHDPHPANMGIRSIDSVDLIYPLFI